MYSNKTIFFLIKYLTILNMENLKIDKTKLVSVTEYAKMKGKTRQRIYQLIKSKDIKSISINGLTLICL